MEYALNIFGPISRRTDIQFERVDEQSDPAFESRIGTFVTRTDITRLIREPQKLKWRAIVEDNEYKGCWSREGEYKILLMPNGSYRNEDLIDDFNTFISNN